MDVVSPKERRGVFRQPGNTIAPVRLRLDAKEESILAKVHDISVSGIGVVTRHHLEPGTWFQLEPSKPGKTLAPELKAEVRYTKKGDGDDYLVGCQFSRLLLTDDIMALS